MIKDIKNNNLPPEFPKNEIQNVSRSEYHQSNGDLSPLELTIIKNINFEGNLEEWQEVNSLPDDIQGHVFICAAVGSIDSFSRNRDQVVKPDHDGEIALANGDGMVYRLDFHQNSFPFINQQRPILYNRIIKPPSYYFDKIISQESGNIANNTNYFPFFSNFLKFRSYSLARLSWLLGVRNQNNTAIIPTKFKGESERLFVTSDIGRPWELDPVKLKLTSPIGLRSEWSALTDSDIDFFNFWKYIPFSPEMACTHAVFDSNTNDFFTANAIRITILIELFKNVFFSRNARVISLVNSFKNIIFFRNIMNLFFNPNIQDFLEIIDKCKASISESSIKSMISLDRIYLLRYTKVSGKENIKRWKIILDGGTDAKISQTLHQIGLSEKYLILADCAFKLAPDAFIPGTQRSSEPQNEKTILFIVPRDKLTTEYSEVLAKRVTLPQALVHYVVDYENIGIEKNLIVLHTAHTNCWDIAEFIRKKDEPISSLGGNLTTGMFSGSTDVNLIRSYIINGDTGEIINFNDVDYTGIPDNNYPWAIGLYAYRNDINQKPIKNFNTLYWNSWGLWKDLFSKYIENIYLREEIPLFDEEVNSEDEDINNIHRIWPKKRVLEVAKNSGIPSQICRVDIQRLDSNSNQPKLLLNLEDKYIFPDGYFATSVQFIPIEKSLDQKKGYIICIVLKNKDDSYPFDRNQTPMEWSTSEQFWIFMADKLHKGPIYIMSHSKLNFGLTTHTTWSQSIESSSSSYDVRKDFNDSSSWLISKIANISSFLEEIIFPEFENKG